MKFPEDWFAMERRTREQQDETCNDRQPHRWRDESHEVAPPEMANFWRASVPKRERCLRCGYSRWKAKGGPRP